MVLKYAGVLLRCLEKGNLVTGLDLHFCLWQKLRFASVELSAATLVRVAFRWVRVRFQQRINPIVNGSFTMGFIGAGDRTRTGTSVTSRDFKSLVSTYSTTPAYFVCSILTHFSLSVKRRKGKIKFQITTFFPALPEVPSGHRRNTFRPPPARSPDPGIPTTHSGISRLSFSPFVYPAHCHPHKCRYPRR